MLETEEEHNYVTNDSPHKQPVPHEIRNKILEPDEPLVDETNRSVAFDAEIDEGIGNELVTEWQKQSSKFAISLPPDQFESPTQEEPPRKTNSTKKQVHLKKTISSSKKASAHKRIMSHVYHPLA